MRLLPRINTCYAVQPQEQGWLILRCRIKGRSLACEPVWQGPLTPDQLTSQKELSIAVEELRRGEAISSIGLSASRSIIRSLKAPPVAPRRLAALIPSLLDVQLPFPVEEAAYLVHNRVRLKDGYRLIVAAARRQDVAEFLSQLQQGTGIDPVVLDHEVLALWDECNRQQPIPETAARIIAYRAPNEWVLAAGNRIGPGAVVTLPAAGGELGPHQAGRIYGALGSAFTEETAEVQLIWCNRLPATHHELVSSMQKISGRTIREVPLNQPDILAQSLARRALFSPPEALPNLRSGELEHPAYRAFRLKRRRAVHAAYLAISLFILGADALFIAAARAAERRWQQRLHQEVLAVTGPDAVVPPGEEMRAARQAMEKRMARLHHFQTALAPAVSSLLSEVLQVSARSAITLQELQLSEEEAHLAGIAPSGREERLVGLLRSFGYNAAVAQRADLGGGNISFVIEAGRL